MDSITAEEAARVWRRVQNASGDFSRPQTKKHPERCFPLRVQFTIFVSAALFRCFACSFYRFAEAERGDRAERPYSSRSKIAKRSGVGAV